MSKFTITNPCLPIGSYPAEFVGVEATDHPEYGSGMKFVFAVTEGTHKGRECCRVTKTEATPKNACGRLLAGLAGVKPSNGLDVDTDDYIGKAYNVLITESKGGDSTRIEAITPVEEPAL